MRHQAIGKRETKYNISSCKQTGCMKCSGGLPHGMFGISLDSLGSGLPGYLTKPGLGVGGGNTGTLCTM